jgi:hypothetical protein
MRSRRIGQTVQLADETLLKRRELVEEYVLPKLAEPMRHSPM